MKPLKGVVPKIPPCESERTLVPSIRTVDYKNYKNFLATTNNENRPNSVRFRVRPQPTNNRANNHANKNLNTLVWLWNANNRSPHAAPIISANNSPTNAKIAAFMSDFIISNYLKLFYNAFNYINYIIK